MSWQILCHANHQNHLRGENILPFLTYSCVNAVGFNA